METDALLKVNKWFMIDFIWQILSTSVLLFNRFKMYKFSSWIKFCTHEVLKQSNPQETWTFLIRNAEKPGSLLKDQITHPPIRIQLSGRATVFFSSKESFSPQAQFWYQLSGNQSSCDAASTRLCTASLTDCKESEDRETQQAEEM